MVLPNFYQKKDLIFIHIPKTGGCSIENVLINHYKDNNPSAKLVSPEDSINEAVKKIMIKNKKWGQHFSLKEIQKEYKIQDLNQSIKIAFVRNPWERAVSEFLYVHKMGGCECSKKPEQIPRSFEKYLLSDFLCSWRNHIKPQASFIKDLNNKINIDFIGRFERFDEDVSKALVKVGLSGSIRAPRFNESLHGSLKLVNPYWSFYNKKTKKIIEEIFKEDIALFSYSFPCNFIV
jgi:chondroitin 4-sulfotransferase 11